MKAWLKGKHEKTTPKHKNVAFRLIKFDFFFFFNKEGKNLIITIFSNNEKASKTQNLNPWGFTKGTRLIL